MALDIGREEERERGLESSKKRDWSIAFLRRKFKRKREKERGSEMKWVSVFCSFSFVFMVSCI